MHPLFKVLGRAAITGAAAFALAATFAAPAQADFPERAITLIAPVGAGGGTDTHARALAQRMSDVLGTPVNVVNRPGAGGYIGAQAVATARPDGYTLMLQSYGTFMLRALGGPQPVSPLEDFDVLGVVGELYTGIAIRRDDERFSNLEEFVAFAQANPDFTYGFSGNGSWHHAAAVAVENGLGYKGRPVVFKGGGAVRAALIGGQVDIAWMGVQQLAGFEAELAMVAVNADARYPLAPDVPTFAEKNLAYTLVTSPMVVAAPKGVDPAVIAALRAAVAEAAASESFKEDLSAKLAVPRVMSAEDGRAYLEGLYTQWAPVAELLK